MDTLRFMYSRHDDSCTETNCKQFSHGYTRDTTHILSCASETVCTYTYDFNSFYTDARDTASCLKKHSMISVLTCAIEALFVKQIRFRESLLLEYTLSGCHSLVLTLGP